MYKSWIFNKYGDTWRHSNNSDFCWVAVVVWKHFVVRFKKNLPMSEGDNMEVSGPS